MNLRSAVTRINKRGILLVFPVKNQKEPSSLWSEFFPRKKMKWEWDEGADNHVGDMWNLMKRLSDCGQVVYSKWYQGRATFFSKELFAAVLNVHRHSYDVERGLTRAARDLFDALESDSPLSTRILKSHTGLEGRINESAYSKGLKQLFSRFVIVGYGESDDGAFPSLCVGSTRLLYEDVWNRSLEMSEKEALLLVDEFLPEGSLFRKFFERQLKANQTPAPMHNENRTVGFNSDAKEDPRLI